MRLSVNVVTGDGDRQESGSYGVGGREGYARFIETHAWQSAVDEAVRQSLVNLDAVAAPAGVNVREPGVNPGRLRHCDGYKFPMPLVRGAETGRRE